MTRTLVLLLLAATLALSACGGPAATAAPTVPPTQVEIPTDTIEPTPTPDLAATEAAQATEQAAVLVDGILGELADLGYSADNGSLAWAQGAPIEVILNQQNYNGVYNDMGIDTAYGDFALGVDVTWETDTGLAGCGFIFRSEDDLDRGQQIQFYTGRLSGAPFWGYELYRFGEFQANLGSGNSNVLLAKQGDTNHYVMIVQGLTATVYANGLRLGTTTLPAARTTGRLAYLTWSDTGVSTCTFENGWVWAIAE